MIFSKDEQSNQLPFTDSDHFNMAKVFICSIFCTISVFLWLAGKDTILGVLIITLGAIWNLFLPLNKSYGLVMSILVGLVYGLVCYTMGLVANAFLYLIYYVPMQYMAIKNMDDTFILKDKKLTNKESTFIFFYYILFFIWVYIFSKSVKNSIMCFMDSVSATLLALSALVRNLRVSTYYKFRFVSLAVSILMWAIIASGSISYSGALSILVMYIMYFVYEIACLIFEHRHYNSTTLLQEQEQKQKAKQDMAQKKKAILKEKTKNV